MVDDRSHIILALVRQIAGSREYFHNTDHTEEEEYHPDDLVALEYISYLLVQFSVLNYQLSIIISLLPVL